MAGTLISPTGRNGDLLSTPRCWQLPLVHRGGVASAGCPACEPDRRELDLSDPGTQRLSAGRERLSKDVYHSRRAQRPADCGPGIWGFRDRRSPSRVKGLRSGADRVRPSGVGILQNGLSLSPSKPSPGFAGTACTAKVTGRSRQEGSGLVFQSQHLIECFFTKPSKRNPTVRNGRDQTRSTINPARGN